MHLLGCEYARWYNRRHRRDGPLFRNRFVSVPVADDHRRLAAFQTSIDINDLESVIGAISEADPRSGASMGRRRPDAFVLLVTLAVELRVESAAQLAQRYGLPSPAAVRTLARRGRVCLVDDASFARLRDRVLAVLDGSVAA